jgi:uncharacterized membrane protein YphA (DoxX/SURF4 family)
MKKTTAKKSAKKSEPKMAEMTMHKNNDKGSCCSGWCKCGPWAMTLLRVVLAGVFLQAGIGKLMTGPAIFGMTWAGYALGAVEAVAGVLLLLGLWTFWSSKVVAVIMLGALVLVHRGAFGTTAFSYPLVLMLAALVLAHYGPGKWAIDNRCCGSGCSCC